MPSGILPIHGTAMAAFICGITKKHATAFLSQQTGHILRNYMRTIVNKKNSVVYFYYSLKCK